MLHYLISERLSEQELLLIASGTVILSAGLASYLHLSPLFVNFILGITLANLPSFTRTRVTSLLLSTEHPFFVVFLIMVGANWQPISSTLLTLAGIYLLCRLAGLYIGVCIGGRLCFSREKRPPADLALTMLPQSGVAIALVIDYMRIHPGAFADLALGIVILAILIQQFIGPTLMVRVLKKHGELNPQRKNGNEKSRSLRDTTMTRKEA